MNAKYSLPSSLSELVVDLECLVVVIGESAATAGTAVVLGAVAVGGGVVIVSMKLSLISVFLPQFIITLT